LACYQSNSNLKLKAAYIDLLESDVDFIWEIKFEQRNLKNWCLILEIQPKANA